MALTVRRNRNENDTADISSAITLNPTTTTTIISANTARIYFTFNNPSNKNVWLKLQAASVDNDKKGIFVEKGDPWVMPPDNIYDGEISAIADVDAPDVYYTEY